MQKYNASPSQQALTTALTQLVLLRGQASPALDTAILKVATEINLLSAGQQAPQDALLKAANETYRLLIGTISHAEYRPLANLMPGHPIYDPRFRDAARPATGLSAAMINLSEALMEEQGMMLASTASGPT